MKKAFITSLFRIFILTIALVAAACGKEKISNSTHYEDGEGILSFDAVKPGYTKLELTIKILRAPEGHSINDLKSLKVYVSTKQDPEKNKEFTETLDIVSGQESYTATIVRMTPNTTYHYCMVGEFEGFDRAIKVAESEPVTTNMLNTRQSTESNAKEYPTIDLGNTKYGGAGEWAWYDVNAAETPYYSAPMSFSSAAEARSYAKLTWGRLWSNASQEEFKNLINRCDRYIPSGKNYIWFTSKYNQESIVLCLSKDAADSFPHFDVYYACNDEDTNNLNSNKIVTAAFAQGSYNTYDLRDFSLYSGRKFRVRAVYL